MPERWGLQWGSAPDHPGQVLKVYIDPRDWWIGYYRGPNHHYVCPIPTVVIRWPRRRRG